MTSSSQLEYRIIADLVAPGSSVLDLGCGEGELLSVLVKEKKCRAQGIEIDEQALPVKPAVKAACEMLGFDPLYVANEGKLVAFVKESDAQKVLDVMKKENYGRDAAVIGNVTGIGKSQVRMRTAIGGTRLVDMLPGELLPRIC